MDSHYAVYLHLDLLEVVPKRGSQRNQIIKFLHSLAENPFTQGDFADKDTSLRQRQIKIINDYAITYWADHPAKSVVVMDIHLADR